LEEASNALIDMSVTAVAGSEKIDDVAAASPLKGGDERLSTATVTLTQKNFATEEYGPEEEEEEEYLNLASVLIPELLKQSRDLP
jgi:hypothetical protein